MNPALSLSSRGNVGTALHLLPFSSPEGPANPQRCRVDPEKGTHSFSWGTHTARVLGDAAHGEVPGLPAAQLAGLA